MKTANTSQIENGELRMENSSTNSGSIRTNSGFVCKNNSQFSILNSQLKIALCILLIAVQTTFSQTTEQRFEYTIRTANIDSAFQKIIEMAESKNGYFTNFSERFISLRFPVEALPEFQSMLSGLAEIQDRNFSDIDRSTELERLNSQIESRKKLLETYMGLVKNAPFAELQSVEREMVTLNSQIERLQGQKQAIEKRAALAFISIRAATTQLPTPRLINHASPFTWINSTNLNTLREDF
ncbi:MAG: DUF4349 domain-containing protein [Fibromonadaceae bacterium]|jgi:hypothetical protein|nr:DUF4349 domain-containing protein [Fibromonadaceae bacterium]